MGGNVLGSVDCDTVVRGVGAVVVAATVAEGAIVVNSAVVGAVDLDPAGTAYGCNKTHYTPSPGSGHV